MIKKRLIFTLLYSDGFFYQSRNYNLQKVGNTDWLKKNYNFRNIAFYIDELIILNVSRKEKNNQIFIEDIKKISEFCFVPISVGGGIKNLDDASFFLKNICDKILINSEILKNHKIINQVANIFGEQSIIIGIDLKKENNSYFQYINNGQEIVEEKPEIIIEKISKLNFGELFLNSIDKDGTCTGLNYEMLNIVPEKFNKPIILSGGTGNYKHIYEGLNAKNVSAIATANLLNFVADGLIKTRNELLEKKIPFPEWNIDRLRNLEKIYKK